MFEDKKTILKSIIQNLNKGRILVIGDFAIDEMIYGQTHRISREAPVLILKHTNTNIILGAASNAANNISALNDGKVSALGVYGNDYHGPILINTLQESGIDTSYMVVDSSRVTTTKTRISGCSAQSVTQQIVRIDREVNSPLNAEIENKVIEIIKNTAQNYDAILLSDYNAGMITTNVIEAVIDTAKKYNLIVAVDTQKDLDRYRRVTVLTPNQPDAERFLGYKITDKASLLRAGKDLLERTEAEMILLTRGGDGMVIFEKNGTYNEIPAFNKTEVFDVTGAGDTVVAGFTLALCTGASPHDSAIIGNLSASIVVRHFGCATTSREELIDNLDKLNMKSLSLNT